MNSRLLVIELAHAWFEFGLAFTMLGQFEAKKDGMAGGKSLSELGQCADRISVLLSDEVSVSIGNFAESNQMN